MQKILFDFITFQDGAVTGGLLYTKKILFELLKSENVKIFGLYDSRIPQNQTFKEIVSENSIELADIGKKKIEHIVSELEIDKFFIGIAQRYNSYSLLNLSCKIYIVCHDISDCCMEYADVGGLKKLRKFDKEIKEPFKKQFKKFIKAIFYPLVIARRKIFKNKDIIYSNFGKLIKQENVYLITVSEYTKRAIEYHLGLPKNETCVFYPPFANSAGENTQASENIINLANESGEYFLFVSSNRLLKNAALFFEQWDKFCVKTNYKYRCILTGAKGISIKKQNFVLLDYVSPADLDYLYKKAFSLIFPSFAEGFGSPPIEAASYGVPSVCSNVTAIPEICGDMAVYFSPFYPEDLYRALLKICKEKEYYSEKTMLRYNEIQKRQNSDLIKLVSMLTHNN